MKWQELFPGKTAIAAARVVCGNGYPYTEDDYAIIRSNLYRRALEQEYTREQLAEVDFANMARQLVKAVVAEQEEQDKKWRAQK